jgi:hypothetical protein
MYHHHACCPTTLSPLSLRARNNSPLRSILLRVSSLSTGEDLQTAQVRDEYLFFVPETCRVSVDTGKLPSVTSRCNLKATMVPVGPINRRTRRTVGRLTGGSCVDMKDESHKVCAFSSKRIVRSVPLMPHPLSGVHNPAVLWSCEADACSPSCQDTLGVKTFMPCRIHRSIND